MRECCSGVVYSLLQLPTLGTSMDTNLQKGQIVIIRTNTELH